MGAQVVPGGVRFRVWAPRAASVEVELTARGGSCLLPMAPEGEGVFSTFSRDAAAGDLYRFRLDQKDCHPDPWSRSQPAGVHGPSEIVDPGSFTWHDRGWKGLSREGLVIYECHVGAFTPEGTFDALALRLGELKRLGITAVELMPVAEFPGTRNWGYDGVYLFAPSRHYGGVAGLKRLLDAAHRLGLGILLDVVYNHLGPDGNYLRAYSPDYFTRRYQTPWGDALNYDGPHSTRVREYVLQNACHWISEYHLDGLRLDATHAIHDGGPSHLLRELADTARASAGDRQVVIIAENDANDVRLLRPPATGGHGLDAVWADDFHHGVRVFLTGDREGYYQDYEGTPQEIARTIDGGFLYQGQVSRHLGRARGTSVSDEPAAAFVFCIENHDQVGNHPFGHRLSHLVGQESYAAASALLLLAPETPLLFMGQEFAASSPFLYFTDHDRELGERVTEGRRQEFHYLEAFADEGRSAAIPDPQALETFQRSKLDPSERSAHAGIYHLYRDLLRLRRSDPVLADQDRGRTRAAALSDRVLGLHRWSPAGNRLLLANFGPARTLASGEHALLAGLQEGTWRALLTTTARRYGGDGARPAAEMGLSGLTWRIPARCAVLFAREGTPPTPGVEAPMSPPGEQTWQ